MKERKEKSRELKKRNEVYIKKAPPFVSLLFSFLPFLLSLYLKQQHSFFNTLFLQQATARFLLCTAQFAFGAHLYLCYLQ